MRVYQKILQDTAKRLILKGLREDGVPWDFTSLGGPERQIKARVIAKSCGVWAGAPIVAAVAELAALHITSHVQDGASIQVGQELLTFQGDAGSILMYERVLLNIVAFIGGIATATAGLVTLVADFPHKPKICPTRKTLPGYRDMALYGIFIGGGALHRTGLSGGILIKENHIAAFGGIRGAIEATKHAPHGLKIEIEIKTREELREALALGVDGVLLDNMGAAEATWCTQFIRDAGDSFVEVSGGITGTSIQGYRDVGADIYSSGYLTHSVKPLDLSLLV